MAWIEGTETQSFEVRAPVEKVHALLGHPAAFQQCFADLDFAEELKPGLWRFALGEKSERGVTFKADYQVKYEATDAGLTWTPVEGNLRSRGASSWQATGPNTTRIDYTETIAVDLPIPRILAKIFGLIVAREIRQDVGGYLDNVRAFLQADQTP